MREIKFRGYNRFDQRWVYGYGLHQAVFEDGSSNAYVTAGIREVFIVDKESVGQYIGCKDIYGKEIYEGDIIERTDKTPVAEFYNKKEIGVVEYKNAQFVLKTGQDSYYEISYDGIFFTHMADYKVIGNIYENKELLEEE